MQKHLLDRRRHKTQGQKHSGSLTVVLAGDNWAARNMNPLELARVTGAGTAEGSPTDMDASGPDLQSHVGSSSGHLRHCLAPFLLLTLGRSDPL